MRRGLCSRRGSTQRSLGSNAKLFTAAAALRGLPPLVTEVLGTAPLAAGGVVDGDLVLRGGGDPGFGAAAAAALAGQVHAAGVRVVTGSVVGDESRFDALRGTPATGNAFHPELGGVPGALTFERGRQVAGGPFLSDPARAAAAAFDDALEALGIVIQGVPRQGVAPPGAIPLGLVSSPVPPLVRGMLKTSDNFIAETLAKALGAQAAGVGTTAAGAAAVTSAAQALRARVRLHDGSGLPVGGRDGTLVNRLRQPGVRGRCQAKTGSLPRRRVSGLSGYCRARGGRRLVFSLLIAGRTISRAKSIEDRFATTLARFPPDR